MRDGTNAEMRSSILPEMRVVEIRGSELRERNCKLFKLDHTEGIVPDIHVVSESVLCQ
jgi:hypothetical protein